MSTHMGKDSQQTQHINDTDVGIIWERFKAAIINTPQQVRVSSLKMNGNIECLSKEIEKEKPNGKFELKNTVTKNSLDKYNSKMEMTKNPWT